MPNRHQAWWGTALALGLVVAVHVSAMVLSLLPPILGAEAQAAASSYTRPLFRQGWSFFAPDPPLFQYTLEARGELEAQIGTETTPWLPLSAPVVEVLQRDRFSTQAGPLTALLFGMYNLAEPRMLLLDETLRQRLLDEVHRPIRKPASLIALERAAAAALARRYPEWRFRAVQVKITLRQVAPRRTDKAERERSIDLVFPYTAFEPVSPWSPE